jgi:S1-C subfamily serine protease
MEERMLPFRYEDSEENEPRATPATQPQPQPAPAPRRRRRGRGRASALLALALVGGTVGGGVAGTVIGARVVAPATAQATTAQVAAPQQVSTLSAVGATVASVVFDQVNDGVVEITVAGQLSDSSFSGGSGSGFVVDADGLILTNYHVVQNARQISVTFNTGEEREATVLGTDQGNDLALLQVDLPTNIPVLPMADSDQVVVGETAIAIGSPFGLSETVTQGIISAVHRDWWPGNGRVQRNLLQTDAPINPGNSGGPLLNANGEVIGINSMIESPVRGSVGVGFAIPINTAKALIPQLEAGAQLEPVWLGITGQDIDQAIAEDQGLSVTEGVLVTSVVPNGPADAANLQGGTGENERIPRGGDVITAIDGTAITSMTDLAAALSGHEPGDVITVTVLRDGAQQEIQVTLQAWPDDSGQ